MSAVSMLPEISQEIYPGITQDSFTQHQITAYRISSMTQVVANVWADMALQNLQQYRGEMPYLVLHDISAAGVGVNYLVLAQYDFLNIGVMPHQRPVIENFMNTHCQFSACVAVVVSPSSSGQFLQLLANRHPYPYEDRITYKTFTDPWMSVEWLSQKRQR